jgi:site-specific DNA recombinase
MNAVIYARKSSDGQREESIDAQIRVCTDYARRRGLAVINQYIDNSITGKTDNRPEFQKMIRDTQRSQFSFILVWKFDRFARNKYDSAVYKRKAKSNNVKVISVTEQIPDDPSGILLESVLEGFAEFFSAA